MTESHVTLFDRIGGSEVVAEMVDAFYVRVLADHELRPFFDGVSLERLSRMQKEFFAAALDGPMTSSDQDLSRSHQDLGISREHVTRFVRHLIGVLESRDAITRSDAMEIIFRIATFAYDVVGDTGGIDG